MIQIRQLDVNELLIQICKRSYDIYQLKIKEQRLKNKHTSLQ